MQAATGPSTLATLEQPRPCRRVLDTTHPKRIAQTVRPNGSIQLTRQGGTDLLTFVAVGKIALSFDRRGDSQPGVKGPTHKVGLQILARGRSPESSPEAPARQSPQRSSSPVRKNQRALRRAPVPLRASGHPQKPAHEIQSPRRRPPPAATQGTTGEVSHNPHSWTPLPGARFQLSG